MSSLLSLGTAARRGSLDEALSVLLDEVESLGGLGPPAHHERARAQLIRIAAVGATTWAAHPELAAADYYARTLAQPHFEAVRRHWTRVLDAHGPWLQARRATDTEPALVAQLRDTCSWSHAKGPMVRFAGEHALELELPRQDEQPRRLRWAWPGGEVIEEPQRAPLVEPARDPRVVAGERALRFRRPGSRKPVLIPWNEDTDARVLVSRSGRALYVYGRRYEEGGGLVRILDTSTSRLKCIEQLEFETEVTEVLEGPAGGLLISTFANTQIRGRGPLWTLEGQAWRLAWSPSGRYLCTLAAGCVEVWDTHVPATRVSRRGPRLLRFRTDGAELLDGCELLDVHSGQRRASLTPRFGNYMVGGPREAWLHFGTQLLTLFHGGLQLWDSEGERIEPTRERQELERAIKAFDHSGRMLAQASFFRRRIELLELPGLEQRASFAIGMNAYLLGLSADASLVAVASNEGVEVWSAAGELRHRAELPLELGPSPGQVSGELVFFEHARTLEYRGPAYGLRWTLDRESLARPEQLPPRSQLPGWSLEHGPVSAFVDGAGRRVELARAGPWLGHPSDPRVLACPGGLYCLRGG